MHMNKLLFTAMATVILCACNNAPTPSGEIVSGTIWPDTQGVHINAHGGGVLQYKDAWYWFGEFKSERTSNALVGVTCYRSKDLTTWENLGVALKVSEEPGSDIEKGCIIERPKVVYNKKTGKFVMWFHLELKGQGYRAARYGVAISDKPEGPYTFLRSGRVNPGIWPEGIDPQSISDEPLPEKSWSPEWVAAISGGYYLKRDFEVGQMARDQTVFVDDDGKAYHIFASEENMTLQFASLTDDYTEHDGKYWRVAPARQNEAPAIFRRDGRYWLICSGCTGWAPNKARMYSATDIHGPWVEYDSPCVGPDQDITFGGQSTYILKVERKGKEPQFIFMADIWRPKHPIDARYIWLPITFKKDGTPVVEWQDRWSLKD